MGDCIQLCLSNATNCTMELLVNEECDAECDNELCMEYPIADDLINPEYHEINGTVYAADFYQCPYNVSAVELSVDIAECHKSANQSIYLDPNVPVEQYAL